MLDSAKAVFQKLSEAVTWPPSRDQLVAERDALLGSPPPPPPGGMLNPPPPPACQCPHCVSRADEEQRLRVAHGSWAGRLRTVETAIFKLTWGDAGERDAVGTELAELHAELVRAADTNRARRWERIVEYDGRGKPLRAHETGPVLRAIAADLAALYRRATGLVFLSEVELRQAIAETRGAMVAALNRPLRQPLDPTVALRAGTEGGAVDAARHGLMPTPGPDQSVLSGVIRFKRRSDP